MTFLHTICIKEQILQVLTRLHLIDFAGFFLYSHELERQLTTAGSQRLLTVVGHLEKISKLHK